MTPSGRRELSSSAVAVICPASRSGASFNSNGRESPCLDPAQRRDADTGQGVGLHHDSGLLSFILQDDQQGLEVQTADGLVQATPVPGTYVMNLGQMMQAASGDYLRATPHRVQSPAPGRQRISLAYFFNPRLEAVFAPVELPDELQAELRSAGDGIADDPMRNDPVHATFGDNTLKIRLRAHPDVAARHYADVLSGN